MKEMDLPSGENLGSSPEPAREADFYPGAVAQVVDPEAAVGIEHQVR